MKVHSKKGTTYRIPNKIKCYACKDTGIIYVANVRHYTNGYRDLGYYDVCTCNKKVVE